MTPIKKGVRDPRVRDYHIPTRVLWVSGHVENELGLLEKRDGQATLQSAGSCILRNTGTPASLLLDFGQELHGGVQITTWSIHYGEEERKSTKLRVRFGESAMEAMSEVGVTNNATNDHAIRDQSIEISFLGTTEFGNTGFRFVRIDLLDEDSSLELKSVRAISIYRDIEYKGDFRSSDPLLDKIWQTGAYTVHLNMQDYLLDGIKRDRLVWIGDLHPEISTVQTVFGNHDIVPRSLDLIRDQTPMPTFMNGILSYSVWWILIQYDWFMYTGDLEYLQEQRSYMLDLLSNLDSVIDHDGHINDPYPFLDWPSSINPEGVKSGIQALLVLAMTNGAKICEYLGETAAATKCSSIEARLRSHVPFHWESKQAAALMALAGTMDARLANAEVISVEGANSFSTFYGYYMLKAKALAGDIQGALDNVREYWGGMLKLGATTFWEDFDLQWMKDAARIDELAPPDKVDVHGKYGGYCYRGYRHSLCHGWASGPTPWLMESVLGIEIIEPGCKVIRISPRLGDLEWVEGVFPTPYGTIKIKHIKQPSGEISTEIKSPPEITIIME